MCKKFNRNNLIMNNFSVNPEKVNLSYYKDYLKKINSIIKSNNLKINKKYQVVIMAAGKGTRMNLNYPKPVFKLNYPYGSNSLIGNIIYTLEKIKFEISSCNIIINKDDEKFFNDFEFNKSKIELIKLRENQIKGTGNCLYESFKFLNKVEDIILIWGDLAIFPKYILNTSVLIKENFKSEIVFPTKIKMNPYVSFLRGKAGEINKVLHSNEGNNYEGYAEQDCSSFVIGSNSFQDFEYFIENKRNYSNSEIDFIHFIPYLNSLNKNVIGLPIVSETYVSGVNTIKKTKKVQKILDKYNKHNYSKFFVNKNN